MSAAFFGVCLNDAPSNLTHAKDQVLVMEEYAGRWLEDERIVVMYAETDLYL